MIQNTKDLYRHKLSATDGEIGHVMDFYFDEQTWVVRYLAADTGSWLSGRQVLLTPHAFGAWDREEKSLQVNLTRQQIEDSPSIETHRPVSRQYEIDYYNHYGWPVYWNGGAMWGVGGFPEISSPNQEEQEFQLEAPHREDRHLQSCKTVEGYAIHATDGQIGKVTGFLVDDRSWAILHVSVEAGRWYDGKEVFIPVSRINRISYDDSQVYVGLSRTSIRSTAEHQVVEVGS